MSAETDIGTGGASGSTGGPTGGSPGVGEYGRRLAGENRASLAALQRSLGALDTLAPPPELPAGVVLRYAYRIGGVGFLHDPAEPVQLTETPTLYAIPNTRAWCRGLANLRGNLVPVYDLAAWMGNAPARRRGRLLVIGADTLVAGLLIDETPAQVRIRADQPEPDRALAPEPLRALVHAVFRADQQVWLEPDYDALFRHVADLAKT